MPWPLGHAEVAASAIECWGSFGLVAKRRVERADVARVVALSGYQRAIFEHHDGSVSPVMFQFTRSFRKALAEQGWPIEETTLPIGAYRDLYRRMRRT